MTHHRMIGDWTEQDRCDFEDNVDMKRFGLKGNGVFVKYRKENKHDFQSDSLRDDGRGRVEQHIPRYTQTNQATDCGADASQRQAKADKRNLLTQEENQNGERNVQTMGD